MTFSSIIFLVYFLPITFGVFLLLVHFRASTPLLLTFVACASLLFYSWAGLSFLLIFLFSVTANFLLASVLAVTKGQLRTLLLSCGIVLNLGLLGYFKYKGFFLETFNIAPSAAFTIVKVTLPVGISFYTFQKIAYLVDIMRGQVKPKPFLHYLFFVTFFPQLVAGPIVRHDDIFPNIVRFGEQVRSPRYAVAFATPGLMLIAVGLAKKMILADGFAMLANPAFELAVERPLTALESWIGLIAYSFQIYFDFSGYSDIALGLALLFGIRLPINFNSPYRASSVIDFWRRWHITLSRFLRDYLYIPLGGNRHGTVRRFVNLMITMSIGGLWHGPSWNFIIWGGLHGFMLSLNHGLHHLRVPALPRPLAIAVVFTMVTLAWVPFRAPDLQITMSYYRSLFGFEGLVLPPFFAPISSIIGITTSSNLPSFSGLRGILAVVIGLHIVWLLPNSLVILTSEWRRLANSRTAGMICAGLIVTCTMLVYSRQATPFIYFQF